MDSLLIATGNRHKTKEISALLEGKFRVEDLTAHPGYPAIEESGSTFLENARLKAEGISRLHPGLVMADDSGLEVDALGGAPGVRSARFAGETATDEENLALLLQRLRGCQSRSARFRCVIVLAREGKCLAHFEGACEGRIGESPLGRAGFGYDPVFIPQGKGETFGELPAEVKNGLSHRGLALGKALAWLEQTFGKTRQSYPA